MPMRTFDHCKRENTQQVTYCLIDNIIIFGSTNNYKYESNQDIFNKLIYQYLIQIQLKMMVNLYIVAVVFTTWTKDVNYSCKYKIVAWV